MTDLFHLNELYAASEDPWHMREGWANDRRRDIMLASLPHARYGSVFEPDCGDGELTVALAARADRLLAVDGWLEAVTETRERTAHLSNVTVRPARLPAQWPRGERFDLVVLSEVGPRLSSADWAELADLVRASLTEDATVLACHSRRPASGDAAARPDDIGRVLEIETVHGLLDSILGLPRHTRIEDADFIADVWTTRPRSAGGRNFGPE